MKATAAAWQNARDRYEAIRAQHQQGNSIPEYSEQEATLEDEVRNTLSAGIGTRSRVSLLKSLGKEVSTYPRRARDRVIATATGHKRRKIMGQGQAPIAIHEDASRQEPKFPQRRLRRMSAQDTVRHIQKDESMQDEYASDESGSDDDPDESVLEDMRKLEESFAGISQRYRLINRIGEGWSQCMSYTSYRPADLLQVHSRPSTKQSNSPRYPMMTLRTSQWTT
jgi:hypothetical protein